MSAERSIRAALKAALVPAMRERDAVALSALRSALAAIDNAEAADLSLAPKPNTALAAVGGLGAGDVPRRSVSEPEMRAIVLAEIAERRQEAASYERLGQGERAARLGAEADVLERHVQALETDS